MYSFDIFDTLIMRKVYSPHGIFDVCQKILQKDAGVSDYLANNFSRLRILAEERARFYSKENEVRLEEIYDVLRMMVSDSNDIIQNVMRLEINMEMENTTGIKANIERCSVLQEIGERVVLISDMYLPETVIREMLLSISPIFENVKIYVSCEYRLTKSSGLLFSKVKEEEKISYEEWIHIGDNPYSDYKVPRLLGIGTELFVSHPLREWEEKMLRQYGKDNNLAVQYVLGTIANISNNYMMNKLEMIGASFAGPILFPYVKWIVDCCMDMGIECLYFVARDGYILKKITDLYLNIQHISIITKYIYGSRVAWRTEEASEKELVREYLEQEMDFINDKCAFVDTQGTGYSIECLSKILGVPLNAFYYDMVLMPQSQCRFYVYSSKIHSFIIEVFCRAPHASTVGYVKKNGKIVPEFYEADTNWESVGLQDYIRGVELYAEKIAEVLSALPCSIEMDAISSGLIDYINECSDKNLLDFIGDMPQGDFDGNKEKRFAPILSKKQIYDIMGRHPYEDLSCYYGTDIKLSLKRSGDSVKRYAEFWRKFSGSKVGIMTYMPQIMGKKPLKRWRIIIYGAGKAGQKLYRVISVTRRAKIVGWTDIDYETYQKKKLPVEPFRKIIKRPYDYIVIAVKRDAENIKMLFEENEINKEQILMLNQVQEILGVNYEN